MQFDKIEGEKCSIRNCSKDAFLRCSHDFQPLCLDHFLKREHFHVPENGEFEDLLPEASPAIEPFWDDEEDPFYRDEL